MRLISIQETKTRMQKELRSGILLQGGVSFHLEEIFFTTVQNNNCNYMQKESDRKSTQGVTRNPKWSLCWTLKYTASFWFLTICQ